MFRRINKFMSILLALAVLLAPLEFAVAHDLKQMPADSKMLVQHHDGQQMDQAMDSNADQECDGQSVCHDCVYCSPALSVSVEIVVDKPAAVLAQTVVTSHYSIDLPVEFRPPRQL